LQERCRSCKKGALLKQKVAEACLIAGMAQQQQQAGHKALYNALQVDGG
jgi:hypothetical protein